GNNFSKWCFEDYDKLVKAAKRTTDVAERTELYKQAQVILKREVPITPLAHSTVHQPMRKEVQDLRISPFALNSFYG
ncbi:ABC transporter substrate-binding protein, partial [Vibrio parahaemolyticus]